MCYLITVLLIIALLRSFGNVKILSMTHLDFPPSIFRLEKATLTHLSLNVVAAGQVTTLRVRGEKSVSMYYML